MMNDFRKPELLSPAGKWDSLKAAVQNGADAVYLGEKSFSARKNAHNFTWEEIKEAVKYCHQRDVKVHLALNTLISDSELPVFENSVIKAAESGIDALIIQDLGAAKVARAVCPQMELHASTQLTASNIYDVEALSKLGFSRVVLSRELSKKEIEHISRNTGAELEAFIHGALCISFSGKCLMSSFIGGRSGNRGECAQPCRQLYTFSGKKGYFLSPRDLCLLEKLKEMYDAGITSFKIEGRMKSPEYVSVVTSVYRKYLDSISPVSEKDIKKLEKIFVRGDGFTKGYFAEKNTPEIMNYSISNDNLSSRADEDIIKEAQQSFREGIENKKISVTASLTLKEECPAVLTLSDGINTVVKEGAICEKAKTLALTKERAQSQIAKLGQTPYELKEFIFNSGGDLTIPVSALNALRRDTCESLSAKRTAVFKKATYSYTYPSLSTTSHQNKIYLAAEISTEEQFHSCSSADRILVPIHLWNKITPNDKCYILLPPVVIDEKEIKETLKKIPASYSVYASSPGMIALAKATGHCVYADQGANIYNAVSAEAFSTECSGITLSPELSLTEIKNISRKVHSSFEAISYGHQRVMTSRACLIRGILKKCDCTSPLKLTDKTGAQFFILGNPKTHLNTVYNSRPTFMADKLKDIYKSNLSGIRLCFTGEAPTYIKEIISMYKGEIPAVKPPIFTRGYLLK